MNIDIRFAAQINKVTAAVVAKEGVIRRTVKVTLAREFDVPLAVALGKDAKKALALLEVGSLTEATIPIDRIVALGVLRSMDQEVRIAPLHGVVAKAKAGSDEGAPPTVKLEFEFDWEKAAWVFLGWNLSAVAEIEIATMQLELGGEAA